MRYGGTGRLVLFFGVATTFIALASSLHAAPRTWTDESGRFRVEAELVEQSPTRVRLRLADGRVVAADVSRLSSADRTYLSRLKPASGGSARPSVAVSRAPGVDPSGPIAGELAEKVVEVAPGMLHTTLARAVRDGWVTAQLGEDQRPVYFAAALPLVVAAAPSKGGYQRLTLEVPFGTQLRAADGEQRLAVVEPTRIVVTNQPLPGPSGASAAAAVTASLQVRPVVPAAAPLRRGVSLKIGEADRLTAVILQQPASWFDEKDPYKEPTALQGDAPRLVALGRWFDPARPATYMKKKLADPQMLAWMSQALPTRPEKRQTEAVDAAVASGERFSTECRQEMDAIGRAVGGGNPLELLVGDWRLTRHGGLFAQLSDQAEEEWKKTPSKRLVKSRPTNGDPVQETAVEYVDRTIWTHAKRMNLHVTREDAPQRTYRFVLTALEPAGQTGANSNLPPGTLVRDEWQGEARWDGVHIRLDRMALKFWTKAPGPEPVLYGPDMHGRTTALEKLPPGTQPEPIDDPTVVAAQPQESEPDVGRYRNDPQRLPGESFMARLGQNRYAAMSLPRALDEGLLELRVDVPDETAPVRGSHRIDMKVELRRTAKADGDPAWRYVCVWATPGTLLVSAQRSATELLLLQSYAGIFSKESASQKVTWETCDVSADRPLPAVDTRLGAVEANATVAYALSGLRGGELQERLLRGYWTGRPVGYLDMFLAQIGERSVAAGLAKALEPAGVEKFYDYETFALRQAGAAEAALAEARKHAEAVVRNEVPEFERPAAILRGPLSTKGPAGFLTGQWRMQSREETEAVLRQILQPAFAEYQRSQPAATQAAGGLANPFEPVRTAFGLLPTAGSGKEEERLLSGGGPFCSLSGREHALIFWNGRGYVRAKLTPDGGAYKAPSSDAVARIEPLYLLTPDLMVCFSWDVQVVTFRRVSSEIPAEFKDQAPVADARDAIRKQSVGRWVTATLEQAAATAEGKQLAAEAAAVPEATRARFLEKMLPRAALELSEDGNYKLEYAVFGEPRRVEGTWDVRSSGRLSLEGADGTLALDAAGVLVGRLRVIDAKLFFVREKTAPEAAAPKP